MEIDDIGGEIRLSLEMDISYEGDYIKDVPNFFKLLQK